MDAITSFTLLAAGFVNSFGPTGPFTGTPGKAIFLASSHRETVTSDLDWYTTIRRRLGFTPVRKWLFYVTGGFALAQIDSTTTVSFDTDQFLLKGFGFSGSRGQIRPGWTADLAPSLLSRRISISISAL
jgi:hypothetical protein